MNTNYCGRSCDGCEHKDIIKCPGCLNGPGNAKMDICELASCCTVKANASCNDCSFNEGCKKLKDHETTPDYIRNKLREMNYIKERKKVLSGLTGKWQMMFFLAIAAVITSALSNFGFLISNTFAIIAGCINIICAIAYSIIILSMGSHDDGYKVAGFCMIGASVSNAVVLFLPEELFVFALFFTLIVAVLGIIASYKEYNAHADILDNISEDLSSSWRTLWKWYIIVYVADILIGSFFPFISIMAFFTVGVLRFVNLYKTTVLLEQLEQ